MNTLPQAVSKLINAFERLPGIGPKTASRLAFYLLNVPQEQLDRFSSAVAGLKKNTVLCSLCFTIAESDPCSFCSDISRDKRRICVVEQPLDLLVLERTGKFNGVYHVLHGVISPLNNIGPDDIYIPQLINRLSKNSVNELIMAVNPTMEGEATAMYIKDALKKKGIFVPMTKLAHGLPVGADLEYADNMTLSQALEGRRKF